MSVYICKSNDSCIAALPIHPPMRRLQALLHKIIARLMKLLTRRGVLVEEEEGGSRYLADAQADSD